MTDRRLSKRVPVTDETLKRLRDFADGLGTTYDESINFLIDYASEQQENAKRTGHRLRVQYDPTLSTDAPATKTADSGS